jgi:hypothetical protein
MVQIFPKKFNGQFLTELQSFAWGAHGAPSQKSEPHGAPWGPIGEIANISFQIKFSVTRCISPESFCNSALIPMKNFVILQSVLDLFEVF